MTATSENRKAPVLREDWIFFAAASTSIAVSFVVTALDFVYLQHEVFSFGILFAVGAVLLVAGARQVVGAAWHVTDSEKYRWLNDSICAFSGEVRAPAGVPPDQIKQAEVKLVFEVAEIVWEAPPG